MKLFVVKVVVVAMKRQQRGFNFEILVHVQE